VDTEAYLDVNVFVYWLGGHPTYGAKALRWMNTVENSAGARYATSALSLYQVLVVMAGLAGETMKDAGFVAKVQEAIMGLPGLRIVPLTSMHFSRALDLMQAYGVDYEDALHLAVAMDEGFDKIVSNDDDFDKTPLKRVF
jgi:predicted nucleic acid-binding protein